MKIAIDRKNVYLIIFIFTCLSIGTAILRNGWYMTWTTLRVRSMTPPFADMRTVQGALLSAKQGLNPQINNPGDPWHRVMNYPKIWFWIAKLFQLDHETNYLVFICTYILAYLVCCFFLL